MYLGHLDLILKWFSLRLMEKNNDETMMRMLAVLFEAFQGCQAKEYTLRPFEVEIIMPYLCEKCGSTKEPVVAAFGQVFMAITKVHSAKGYCPWLINGLKGKNVKSHAACLAELRRMVLIHSPEIIDTKKDYPVVVSALGSSDKNAKAAALSVVLAVYTKCESDPKRMYKVLGIVPDKVKAIIEKSLKGAKSPDDAELKRLAGADVPLERLAQQPMGGNEEKPKAFFKPSADLIKMKEVLGLMSKDKTAAVKSEDFKAAKQLKSEISNLGEEITTKEASEKKAFEMVEKARGEIKEYAPSEALSKMLNDIESLKKAKAAAIDCEDFDKAMDLKDEIEVAEARHKETAAAEEAGFDDANNATLEAVYKEAAALRGIDWHDYLPPEPETEKQKELAEAKGNGEDGGCVGGGSNPLRGGGEGEGTGGNGSEAEFLADPNGRQVLEPLGKGRGGTFWKMLQNVTVREKAESSSDEVGSMKKGDFAFLVVQEGDWGKIQNVWDPQEVPGKVPKDKKHAWIMLQNKKGKQLAEKAEDQVEAKKAWVRMQQMMMRNLSS